MTMRRERDTSWRRDKRGLGIWPHRGKTAIVGIGHGSTERRWDGKSMDKTLGAIGINAINRAMADAGVKPEDVDGLLCCPENGDGSGGPAGKWAPRPYFSAPYDSEDGLSIITPQWLTKNGKLPAIKYAPENCPAIGEMMGMAAQVIAEGRCHTCLVVYTMGNLEGRYRQGGEANTSDYAKGGRAFTAPWGSHGGNMFINIFRAVGFLHQP
ncbi:MAG: putative thiolase [Dehalococcoidia bacterium]|nr:putative thiolase [Dehalococcoidia bacterium]